MSYKLLKQAADQLDALANKLEAAEAAAAANAVKSAAVTKTASDQASADLKTKRISLAKTAADKLLAAGLLSSAEKRDQFAAEITDPDVALAKLAKFAESVTLPALGKVVRDETTQTKVANSEEVWANSVNATLSRLNLK